MKIIVLGGTGFLGTALHDALVISGHKAVRVSRSQGADVQVDLRREEGVWSLLANEAPDLIINMATAGLSTANSRTRANDLFAIDVKLPRIVVNWMKQAEKKTRFLHVSSSLNQVPIESDYARAKRDGREALCNTVNLEQWSDIDVRIANIHNCYGPSQPRGRFISDAIDTLERGDKLVIRHPSRQRDFVYVSDVISSLLRLISDSYSGPTEIEVGTGYATSVADAGKIIAQELGLDPSRFLVLSNSPTSSDRVVASEKGGTLQLCNTKLEEGIRLMRVSSE